MPIAPGQSLLHYRIVDKIGEGGMGVVWRAFDSKLDREVAIKILPDALARDPARLERFRREAKAIAALNHPNVVTIHSIERDGDRRFLVMELIEGESLDKIIPPGGLPLSQLFEIAIPITVALATAHDKGLVHRDVKPANVMVARTGHVTMLDFGLAKLATEGEAPGDHAPAQAPTRTAALTGEGHVLGTAPYMSPEQLQGREVDRRSDIFSLGIVLYEMVSGQRPFQGLSGIDLASAILKDTPPSIADVRADVPRHLVRIIEQCLEKNPDDRFQTARDVSNQLTALRRELASEATGVSAAVAPPRRRWVGAAALALLLVGAGGYLLWRTLGPFKDEAPSSARTSTADRTVIVVLPFENLGAAEDEYFTDGMTEEITSRLAAMDGLAVISRTSAMQYKDARPSLRQIGEELGVDYVLEGSVRWQNSPDGPSQVRVTPQLIQVSDDTHLWTERYDRVLADIFEVQSDIAVKVSEQLGLAILDPQRRSLARRPTENLEAYDAYLRGNDYLHRGQELNAGDEVHFAIQMYENAVRLDPTFALAHARLSAAHTWLYHNYVDRNEERAAAARRAVERAFELDPRLPEAHYARGLIYFEIDWDTKRALEEFRTVLESQPSNATVYEAMSEVQQHLGQWEEGRATLEKAMQLNPRLGRLACWTGGHCLGLRDFDGAVHYHERAIRLTPDRTCPYYCMATIHLNRDGDTEAARRFLERLSPQIDLEATPPINYPWVLLDLVDGRYEDALQRLSSGSAEVYQFLTIYIPKDLLRAQIFDLQGQPQLARQHYEAARARLEAAAEEVPNDERIRSALGIAYAGLGRDADAVREGKLALELLQGSRDERLGYRIRDLAQIYSMVGDPEQAIDQLEQLLSIPAFFSAQVLRVDPTWQELRDHPRFRALVERRAGPDRERATRAG